MSRNGKHRWRFSLHRSPPKPEEPPKELLCPISGSLMADPVVVSSGQTFERACVQACRELGFSPTFPDGSSPDFTAWIPNLALKSTVLRWCDASGVDHPRLLDCSSAEGMVRTMMTAAGGGDGNGGGEVRVSDTELLRAVTERPPVTFSHAATELNHRHNLFDSSSDESSVVIASPSTPLPLATRPSCYSSSSEVAETEAAVNPSSMTMRLDEEGIAGKLKSEEVFEQEAGVIALRKMTRGDEKARVSLCTPRLLFLLKPLLTSHYSVVQRNAVAALVNLSLEKANKVRIVRSGVVPPLIDVLKGGSTESQEHAAGALFSLALEDDNKAGIGVLGALHPLLHALRSDSELARHDSAMALYHLSLIHSNRVKMIKLGAVPVLLALACSSASMAARVLLTLCNLAACAEGRSAMLDCNAMECLVGMLRGSAESTRENCVAALYSLSHGSIRFKGLAKEAGVADALREVEERGSERAREKARRILQMMKKERDDGDGPAEDSVGVLDSAGLSRTRYRLGGGGNAGLIGANSTEF